MCDQTVLKLPQETFMRRKSFGSNNDYSEGQCAGTFTGTPIILNFRRFIKLAAGPEQVPGVKNTDLLHAVAALYDQALPDVTEDIIYSTVCEKWARTILLIQDPDEALEYFKQRALCRCENRRESEENHAVNHQGESFLRGEFPAAPAQVCDEDSATREHRHTSTTTENDAVLHPTKFSDVFSDMETSDEEDEEEDEDFSKDVDEFLQDLRERKQKKKLWLDSINSNNCSGEPKDLIGIEHRLMGCLTFDRVYPKPGHKVIHLTLIAVRKRFRKMLVGQFLTDLIRNPVISGKFDAILVNADHRATEFFEKQGFSGDVILNSKYEEIGDTWYNCKRMCYLPPYQSLHDSDIPSICVDEISTNYYAELEALDLKQMDLDYTLYQQKSLQAFQCQALIMERLRKEVILLRAKVSAQQDTIEALKKENYIVRDEKYNCEKEYLRMKLKFLTDAAEELNLNEEVKYAEGISK